MQAHIFCFCSQSQSHEYSISLLIVVALSVHLQSSFAQLPEHETVLYSPHLTGPQVPRQYHLPPATAEFSEAIAKHSEIMANRNARLDPDRRVKRIVALLGGKSRFRF